MNEEVSESRFLGSAFLGREGPNQRMRLLLVGADATSRRGLRDQLQDPRWTIREARSGSDALERLLEEGSEVMLLDPQLPDLECSEFQAMVRSQHPDVQIVLIPPSTTNRVSADFGATTSDASPNRNLQQPCDPSQDFSSKMTSPHAAWQGMIGCTAVMQQVFRAARLVARHQTTVLIQGESGTGKDLVARGIHAASARSRQPFAVINCAAIPEALLEAELFGYAKGSFTGAAQSRIGRIQAAHGGTLFLDEIGDMPFLLQSKLLRFLEQGEIQRIGETETLKVDCRIIAATNADLKTRIVANQFREDLFYRLAVFPIQLPPLRERMQDLDLLMGKFLGDFCPGVRLHGQARSLLLAHSWPGNIRELRNVMERASLFSEGRSEILPEDIML